MKRKILRKALAVATSVLMLSGSVPIKPISDIFGDMAITANAETTTSTVNVGGTDYTLFTGFTATGGSSGTGVFTYEKMVDGDVGESSSFHDFSDVAYVEFNSDKPIIPKGYIVNLYNFNSFSQKPNSWVLKAKANTDDEWAVLSSYSGQNMVSEQQYACNNDGNTPYKYFRFEASNTNNNIWLTEIRLYGSSPDVYYTHLTKKDATCTETGIKQDCYLRNDGKYFTDETGTTELAESDVIDPIKPHTGEHHDATDVNIEYWQCSMCSKYFSNEGCTTEITEEDTKIYRTITIDGSNQYTFTVPADNVTVTAETLSTYSFSLPDNMEMVSATNAADGNGKYISGTVIKFAASIGYAATNVSDGTNTLEPNANGVYTVTIDNANINITATVVGSSTLYLARATSDFTAADGETLVGSTSHTVTIANGANITLNNATITGGIVCEGTATITLDGTNSVSVEQYKKAGIQIGGSGTTLTIRGDGSLTATGGSAAAGIGLGRTWDASVTAGAIVIEGGIINASGDIGIGIGTVGNSQTATIDGISIKGGTVSASLGKGYIYNGSTATVGYIKIYDTIDMVDASKITETVTYMHVDGETATDVTANKTDYFTIGENGDRRIIVPKDDTNYTITIADGIENGTITGATTAKYMETVTINATPDFGYRFVRLVVKDADNNDVASTNNTFQMPKSNVTVSAVFEQGTHGTTEFTWFYSTGPEPTDEVRETIYDGATTVNIQQTGQSYNILKYDEYTYSNFRLDNNTYDVDIPYAGGTGGFYETGNATNFSLNYDGETGYYDITMTDVGNGKWGVSILPTAAQMDVVPDQTYTGSAITPEPLVIAGSLSLTKGTDYVYSYDNNTNVGTATVRATFQGDYESLGYVEKTFTIKPSTIMVNVTGSGTVTIGDKSVSDGEAFGVMSEKGASVVLTLAPESGNVVRSVEYGYTNSKGTNRSGVKLPISDGTATLTVPNDLKDGTGVTLTVTFAAALVGGADEAGAVALTDAAVTDLAGGWYKVTDDITFDHTLNLLGDTHLTIADGKTMTVNTATDRGIDSDYTLTVRGAGALSVTASGSYPIAVRVGSYVQTGATVTASGFIGIRCCDVFDADVTNDLTFSGGQLTVTGTSDGIWADNTITISCTNASDFIQSSSYEVLSGGTIKVADGKALTDGTNIYTGTLTDELISAIAGKKLSPVAKVLTLPTSIANGTLTADQSGDVLYGETVTLTVTPDEGYVVKSVSVNGTAITPTDGVYSFEMPAEDVTVTAKFEKPPVSVNYIDENGTEQTVDAIPLDNTMTTLEAGIYVVNSDVTYNSTVTLGGDVTLILCDNKTMSITINDEGYCIDGSENNTAVCDFTIYGQSEQTGALTANGGILGFVVKDFGIHGGNITCNNNYGINTLNTYMDNGKVNGNIISRGLLNISGGEFGNGVLSCTEHINHSASINISGGIVNIVCTSDSFSQIAISGDHISITGGQVTAIGQTYGISSGHEINLGFTGATDFVQASSFSTMNDNSIEIQNGLTYTDGTNFYSGTLTYERYEEIAGKKLVRYDGYGARLEGYSLSIQNDGDIGVNFYMLLDESIVNNQNAKMRFVIPINSKTGETKTLDMDIPTSTELGGKTYYVFKCPVAAKEMTAAITAQMYVDGVATGNQYTYTVRDYAEYLINHAEGNEAYTKALPLVKAMLHYGASAQTLFNNIPGDLANKNIAPSAYDAPTQAIKDLIDASRLTNLNTASVGDNLTFDGASLNLGSKTAYTLYYKKEAGYSVTAPTIACSNHDVDMVENKNEIRYIIRNISAGDLLNNITVTIGGNTLTVNPATYFYAALTAENTAEYNYDNLKTAVTALYYFNEAAKSYKEVQ